MQPNHPSGALTNINGEELLKEITFNAEEALATFTETNEIASVLETAFGTNVAIPQAALLTQNWLTGDLLEGLEADITLSSELDSASGAYAAEQDTIYLSQKFLTQATVEEATDVLLEEIGHAVDAELNPSDSPGDEGAIFSSLVQGEALSQSELAQLRGEDDSATLEISGETVAVEQADFIVTNSRDSGQGSLRNVISQANQKTGKDTITFQNTLNGKTIDLTSGELEITDDLIINGLGSNEIRINANSNSRVFRVDDENGDNIDVTISGLTISGGSVSNKGGGILNKENLTLSNSTVSGNSATYGGGGIYTEQGNLIVSNSKLSDNSGNYGGGGILSQGSSFISNTAISDNYGLVAGGILTSENTTISNSTLSGNTATLGGGGIVNYSKTTQVTNSTISGNSGGGLGGGIVNYSGTINVKNSTLSGNSATYGGAITNGETATNASSTAFIENSTISGNSATEGAGIYNYTGTSTITLANSIIANPSDADDIVNEGTINTEGANLVEDSSLTGERILNEDPQLSPLQDNGGFTLTQLPLGNSPVIDAGINTAIPTDDLDFDGDGNTEENLPFDQRNLDRIVNGTVDLGAVEVQESRELVLEIANVETTEGDADTNTTLTFTATLNNAPFEEATVDFVTTDNAATAGEDYESTEGTLTFEEGETEQTIEVTVFGDNTSESNESFSLELSNPSESLKLAKDTVTGTILNDDSGNNNPDPTPAGANVFRFYNTEAGGHFYTTSEEERDFVKEELPKFNFEGTSFLAAQPGDEEAVPVFRFYNTEAGGHFYTTSEEERDMVKEFSQFNFEGIGFYAYEEALAETNSVFRFFNTGAGGHFYTPSAEERDFVKEELSDFNFEGTGFYANPVSEA